ncbi:hypothetical protein DdX_21874 [Ditylenchus destructor]|uniref:Uncharacterized protein n=1 Tax=Ditylenchus destructor TaxID=166010 RepID=A0AAD4MEA3_9BILA|nr:hypothetical protein DdX_21874 [Ditylenchus destructor]
MIQYDERSAFPCYLFECLSPTDTELIPGFSTQMPGDSIILSNEVLQLQHHEQVLPMNFLNGMPGLDSWLAPVEPSLTSMERNVVMKVHEFDISDESFTTFSMANVYNEETYPNTQGTISIPSEITTPLQRINPICEYNHLYETLLQHTAFFTNIAQQQVHHENNLDQSSYNDNEYIEDVNLPEIMARQDQGTKAVISTKSPGNIQKISPREHDEEIELTPDWKNGSRKVRDSVQRMNGKNDSRIGKNLRSMECGKNDDYTTVEASEGTVSTGTLGTLNEDDKLKKLGEVVLNTFWATDGNLDHVLFKSNPQLGDRAYEWQKDIITMYKDGGAKIWHPKLVKDNKINQIIEGGVVKEIVTAYTVLWAAYRIIEFGYELYSNEAGADERCRTTRICTWVKKKTGQKIVPNESRKIANELLELMRKVSEDSLT